MSAANTGELTRSSQRAEAQRERILLAAQKCFVKFGFHAASMASIAETADMSPGLIYRYFKGKNDIILAIIERQLMLLRKEIAQLDGTVDLPTRMTDGYTNCSTSQKTGLNHALVLEMSAEATRDRKIASALAAFDATIRSDIADWLGRSLAPGNRPEAAKDVAARALMLQCVIDGLKVRQTREPGLDRGLLKTALERYLPILLQSGLQDR